MGIAPQGVAGTTRTPLSLRSALPGPRAWLRAHPRLQGMVVAPSGLRLELPHTTGGVYVLLYHGVTPDQERGLRHHLATLLDRGRFVSWDAGLAALAVGSPLTGPHFCLTFDDGHKEWVDRVLPLLAEQNLNATFFITTDNVAAGGSRSQLTWQDCKQLVDAGMRIGSHTVTHRRLSQLDYATARREIADSKDKLEQRLGIPVHDFSAPYGLPQLDFTDRDVNLARESGYRTFASALPGRMEPGHPLFDLRRCGLSPSWPIMAVRKRVHE